MDRRELVVCTSTSLRSPRPRSPRSAARRSCGTCRRSSPRSESGGWGERVQRMAVFFFQKGGLRSKVFVKKVERKFKALGAVKLMFSRHQRISSGLRKGQVGLSPFCLTWPPDVLRFGRVSRCGFPGPKPTFFSIMPCRLLRPTQMWWLGPQWRKGCELRNFKAVRLEVNSPPRG